MGRWRKLLYKVLSLNIREIKSKTGNTRTWYIVEREVNENVLTGG
jgi:hypothetical protein